ncbi:MAG: hypothetical protein HKN68_09360 [Saprospiraceae bacterium]|nr:hypothetical protein [Saprospiraceae bacterium]
MRFILIISIFLITIISSVSGQGYFEITDDIREAYQLTISLKKEKALQKIADIKQTDPGNYLVYHIENYVDFFEVFINEDEDTFKRLEKNKDKRIDKIKEGDKSSPFYRFSQAEIQLQWALARSKFNQKFKAARELLNANGLLEENAALHPDFIYNYKSLSIIHVLSRSVPGLLRYLFNIRGSIEEGTKEIATLYEASQKNGMMFQDEIVVIYTYILYYQNNKKEEALDLIQKHFSNTTTNHPLISFIAANFSQKMGNNDLAINMLTDRIQSEDATPFYYLDFLIGKFKLYRLDEDADQYLLKFINNFEGQHYIREAYQKMAWHQLVIHDDLAGYKKYMSMVTDRGNDLIDEDKQAEKEAKLERVPHPDLLKARLLFDGAYYNRAYNLLIKKSVEFQDPYDQMEYNYRMGRITHLLKNYTDAINYYVYTINKSEGESYIPCNAALQIALILEDQERYAQALHYLDICLDMSPEEYKNSLHQKAKSAKLRVKEIMKKKPE